MQNPSVVVTGLLVAVAALVTGCSGGGDAVGTGATGIPVVATTSTTPTSTTAAPTTTTTTTTTTVAPPPPVPTTVAAPVAVPPVQPPATVAKPATTTKKPATTTKRAAAAPPPPAEKAAPVSKCDPNYSGCVPVASDVDCAGGSGNGPAYVQGPVRVIGSDVYGLDNDKDGVGCE